MAQNATDEREALGARRQLLLGSGAKFQAHEPVTGLSFQGPAGPALQGPMRSGFKLDLRLFLGSV